MYLIISNFDSKPHEMDILIKKLRVYLIKLNMFDRFVNFMSFESYIVHVICYTFSA